MAAARKIADFRCMPHSILLMSFPCDTRQYICIPDFLYGDRMLNLYIMYEVRFEREIRKRLAPQFGSDTVSGWIRQLRQYSLGTHTGDDWWPMQDEEFKIFVMELLAEVLPQNQMPQGYPRVGTR